jgi:RHS repeat-associated protein
MSGPLADANLYRFSSKEAHVPSGLIYYLYRYFDPNLQRWTSRDPIQTAGGINLYAFGANNPVGLFDTDGRSLGAVVVAAIIGYTGYKGVCSAAEGWVAKNDSPPDKTRYAHCLASCRIKKQCGRGAAVAAGFLKELKDFVSCMASSGHDKDHCYSAFQPKDFEDNKTGRSCPPEKSCEEHCKDLMNQPEPPPGPFYMEEPLPPSPGMSSIAPSKNVVNCVV